MKKIGLIVLFGGLMVAVAVNAMKAQEKHSMGRWSGFTVDQLAEHLGLQGGNVAFRFDNPRFMNVRAVLKKGEGQPRQLLVDDWSTKRARQHKLFVKIKDISKVGQYVGKNVKIEHSNAGTNAGVGMNPLFESRTGNYRHYAAWQNRSTAIETGQRTTIYEFCDGQAPEEAFFRLSILFSETRPEG